MKTTSALSVLTSGAVLLGAHARRPLERLGRGVVAVRTNDTDVLVSWRLLGLDPEDLEFNVYRAAGDEDPVQLNDEALTGGTNYADHEADLSEDNTYFVYPVIDGEEQYSGGNFTLPADNPSEPIVRIPIQSGGSIKFVWVGDLDGDGEYDFVLDRQTTPQALEAYSSDGTLLWEVDMGPNSENQDNISPGSATINVGHWDGVTVYDFDSDGYAEVAVRIANGVTFGDGETFNEGSNDEEQFIAFLDGQTGVLRGSAQVPDDYISDGPLAARLGVGYLDGETPHLVAYMKNRQESGGFNLIESAWTFDGSEVSMAWVWHRGDEDAPDGHNTRAIDADGDGKDEVHEIGFVLSGDGELHYSLGPEGIVHGDRFHIAKMDPDRAGLQGYGVQQRNPSGLLEYYYDATDGSLIWEHYDESDSDEPADVGRGMVGDIDPMHEGMEVWSFSGVYNAPSDELTTSDASDAPWPHLGIFWDGDILLELYNDGKFEKWNWTEPTKSGSVPRLLSISDFGAINTHGPNPGFHGDILGDWREEVILVSEDNDELIIFTTDQPTDVRLYTLAHNPAYRNSMTFKGYVQSHHVDYFIGQDMEVPSQPDIRYNRTSGDLSSYDAVDIENNTPGKQPFYYLEGHTSSAKVYLFGVLNSKLTVRLTRRVERDDEFILTGYRVASFSYPRSSRSIFQIHNETANIWSHLLGALWFIHMFVDYFYVKRLGSKASVQDSLALGIYYLCVAVSFILSTSFHTFSDHSPGMHTFGNQLDHLGIVLVMWGSGIYAAHFAFRCRLATRCAYFALLTAVAFGCGLFTLRPKFRQPAYRTTRFLMYVALGASLFLPVTHGALAYGPAGLEEMMGLWSFFGLGVINFSGAAVYAARIPERWFPMKFDLTGRSHNWMHVLVLAGALVRLRGLLLVMDAWEEGGVLHGLCDDLL